MSVGVVNKTTGDRIPTAGMPAIDNALDLTSVNPVQNAVITAAIAGKQDTLTFDDAPTDNSNNPVKSNGIYDALALKQNATDNSLETTDKTIVGAINEHEGDVNSLKSGLTNLDTEVNGDATVYPYADVITIEDAVPANLAGCTAKIEPVQSGSGDPSPENIRPITGHTESIVTVVDDAESPTVTKTYTIALGDTIYGGTVDFDSGVMLVDRAIVVLGSLSYTYLSETNRFSANIAGIKLAATRTLDIMSECYEPITDGRSYANVPNNSIYNGERDGKVFIHDNRYTDPTDLATALDGMNLVYPLATPLTVQLTPQQIQLLKGQNTLTASTGQISVTVNGVSGAIGSVQEQANNTDEALAELADKLPTAPTTDGAYVLTVTVADGTPTYSWESAS